MAAQPQDYYTYIGLETLRRMSAVDKYNLWVAKKMAPYVGQRILEIGAGIGNMTEPFLDRELLVTIDILPEAIDALAERHRAHVQVQPSVGDIVDPTTVSRLKHCLFDTAMCTNVLEHIEQDETALHHMADLLISGGHLVLFVPAGQYMYGTLDVALGHFRRYEARGLRALVERAGLTVERMDYCNLTGIPGWWLNSRVLKRDLLPIGQLKLFNALAPLTLGLEDFVARFLRLPVGQSLLCIARKA
jgi:SAM-dependent methyltransferase